MTSLPPTTSSKLLEAVKEIDSPAWTEFYDTYWEFLVRQARRSGLSNHDAEEVAQQTLIAMARCMPGFVYDRTKGSFRDFLFRTLQNKICDLWRFRGRRPPHVALGEGPPDRNDPLQQTLKEEFQTTALQKILDKVRPLVGDDALQIFVSYFLKDESAKEVAQRIGMTSVQVANRAWAVMFKLREMAQQNSLGEPPL